MRLSIVVTEYFFCFGPAKSALEDAFQHEITLLHDPLGPDFEGGLKKCIV